MSKKLPLKHVLSLIYHDNKVLILSQTLFVLVALLILVPFLTLSFNLSLKTVGVSYVTLSNLSRFAFHPVTLLFVALIFLVLSTLIIFEDVFLKEYFYLKHHQLPLKGLSLISYSLSTLYAMIKTFKYKQILNAWARLMTYNLPLLVFAIDRSRFFAYLKGEINSLWVWLAFLLFYVLIVLLSHRKQITFLRKFILWNFVQGVIFLVIYLIIMATTVGVIAFSVNRMFAVAALISAVARINAYFVIFLFVISTCTHYALYVVMAKQTLDLSLDHRLSTQKISIKELVSTKPRLLGVMAIAIVLALDVGFYINILQHGSRLQSNLMNQIEITSHRGYSYNYPENTLVAIERAIEVYSDYVEVDVRATKDREFVLLHDASLRRTTGVNQLIWDVNYSLIEDFDAGKWMSAEFEGVTIPRLQDAFDLAKGRIFLNLDLKLTNTQLDLMAPLVDLILEYEMQYQTILTSTCLQCLEVIKTIEPSLQTGYITYRITPQILANPSIDLISMKASLVTQSTVDQIHESGKKVLVWTVNSRQEIERVSRIGVNNIITDRPAYAKEVLFQLHGDRFLVSLIKALMD